MIQYYLPDTLVLQWKSNYRLRLGCWCVLCIVCYLLYQFLADVTEQVQDRCQEKNTQIIRLQRVANEDVWFVRSEEISRTKKDLETRLLVAESRGLAQASTQTWITSLLQQQDVKHRRVKVTPPVPLSNLPGVWQVSARVEGDFRRQSLFKILLDLESVKHLLSVERLEVQGRKKQRFVMDVKVFCTIIEQ